MRMVHRDDHVSAGIKLGTPHFQVNVFQPYVETDLPGGDVLIESKSQRDALLKQHGLTMDRFTNIRKPPTKTALEEMGFDKWGQAMQDMGVFERQRMRAEKLKKEKKKTREVRVEPKVETLDA